MKNLIYALLVCGFVVSCGKEPETTNLGTAPAAQSDQRVIDQPDNCNVVACSIKFQIDINELNAMNLFKIYENYESTPVWLCQIGSFECASFKDGPLLMSDVWYPINFIEYEQYAITFKFEQPCSTHGLANEKAKVFIKTNGNIREFDMSTGTNPETNPDLLYFYRTGCAIYEGQIE